MRGFSYNERRNDMETQTWARPPESFPLVHTSQEYFASIEKHVNGV